MTQTLTFIAEDNCEVGKLSLNEELELYKNITLSQAVRIKKTKR